MNITIIQPDIIWENKKENLKRYENLIKDKYTLVNNKENLIILPEMFTTGFTMSPEKLSENMNGDTIQWMKKISNQYNCAITGSIIIKENNNYYNRMLWVSKDVIEHYDKKHLFRHAEENEHYTAGNDKKIIDFFGYKILLLVCYDLRFPVWSRNQNNYDMIIYVANWPEQRRLAWKRLLQARAIENQCYVIGVNRVGIDNKGNKYSGDSSVFSPNGEKIWQESYKPVISTLELNKDIINNTRDKFPFYLDSDKFEIKNY